MKNLILTIILILIPSLIYAQSPLQMQANMKLSQTNAVKNGLVNGIITTDAVLASQTTTARNEAVNAYNTYLMTHPTNQTVVDMFTAADHARDIANNNMDVGNVYFSTGSTHLDFAQDKYDVGDYSTCINWCDNHALPDYNYAEDCYETAETYYTSSKTQYNNIVTYINGL